MQKKKKKFHQDLKISKYFFTLLPIHFFFLTKKGPEVTHEGKIWGKGLFAFIYKGKSALKAEDLENKFLKRSGRAQPSARLRLFVHLLYKTECGGLFKDNLYKLSMIMVYSQSFLSWKCSPLSLFLFALKLYNLYFLFQCFFIVLILPPLSKCYLTHFFLLRTKMKYWETIFPRSSPHLLGFCWEILRLLTSECYHPKNLYHKFRVISVLDLSII